MLRSANGMQIFMQISDRKLQFAHQHELGVNNLIVKYMKEYTPVHFLKNLNPSAEAART